MAANCQRVTEGILTGALAPCLAAELRNQGMLRVLYGDWKRGLRRAARTANGRQRSTQRCPRLRQPSESRPVNRRTGMLAHSIPRRPTANVRFLFDAKSLVLRPSQGSLIVPKTALATRSQPLDLATHDAAKASAPPG